MSGNLPADLLFCRGGLSHRTAQFKAAVAKHDETQKKNPFSGSFLGKGYQQLDKNDPNYGRPVAGSKTEYRGKKAQSHVTGEILTLCEMIYESGVTYEGGEEGTKAILFGELFQIYTRISNKLVGILLRARKHGLLFFEGEVLFQRRDDDEPIFMMQPIGEIREMFRSQQKEED